MSLTYLMPIAVKLGTGVAEKQIGESITNTDKEKFAEEGVNYAECLRGHRSFSVAHDFFNQQAGLGDFDAANTVFSDNKEEREQILADSKKFLYQLTGDAVSAIQSPIKAAMHIKPILSASKQLTQKISTSLRAGAFDPPAPGGNATTPSRER